MPGHIHRLPSVLIDRIAAGEVVERPASVVKELVENSLDAGATHIRIETTAGGLESILIQDDGSGIAYSELPLAVERHATSKIDRLEDLDHVLSYGFRGEALAAIASVSYLELRSTEGNSPQGGMIAARGGELLRHEADAPAPGTSILIQDLFYTTPARKKFLKSQKTEDSAIHREVLKLALAVPEVSFEYNRDGREILNLPADSDQPSRIAAIYGREFAGRLLPVKEHQGSIVLSGYIGDDRTYRTQTDRQFTCVNRRPVEVRHLSFFVRKAYGELIPAEGGRPVFFLNLQVQPDRLDVNVHPAKREVRLTDEGLLHNIILTACQRALFPDEPLPFLRGGMDSIRSSNPLSAPLHDDRSKNQPIEKARAPAEGLLYSVDDVLAAGSTIHEGPAEEIRTSPQPPGEAVDGRFVPLRHFGVIFGTYILAEGEGEFYFIDQHTAHERVNFEKKRHELEQRRFKRQMLLHPVPLEFGADESERVLAGADHLLEAGFLVEEIGPGRLVLREAPDFLEPGEEGKQVERAIQRLAEGEDLVRVYDEYAAMKACKASIKRNDRIAPALISEILRDLGRCDQPSRCPHGRPTILRLTRAELDRLFLRTGFTKRVDERI